MPAPADEAGILGHRAASRAYSAHAEQHPAAAYVIAAGADDDGADIIPPLQHPGAENGGLAGIARLVFDQDLLLPRAELQEQPPHRHGFGRRMAAEPAGDEEAYRPRCIGEPHGGGDAAAKRAAGRPVHSDGRAEDDDAIVTRTLAGQGPRSFPAIAAAPP